MVRLGLRLGRQMSGGPFVFGAVPEHHIVESRQLVQMQSLDRGSWIVDSSCRLGSTRSPQLITSDASRLDNKADIVITVDTPDCIRQHCGQHQHHQHHHQQQQQQQCVVLCNCNVSRICLSHCLTVALTPSDATACIEHQITWLLLELPA